MYKNQENILKKIKESFPPIFYYRVNEDIYLKTSVKYLWNLMFFLKWHTGTLYNQLIDLSFLDFFEKKYRFEVFYNVLSIVYNNRMTITAGVLETVPVESICMIYSNANWYERESWDMFGIFFLNHIDFRRMLTDYGFKGHPLRKDFPMTGYLELRYDDFLKRILYEKVSLTQEYRVFNLENNWSFNF